MACRSSAVRVAVQVLRAAMTGTAGGSAGIAANASTEVKFLVMSRSKRPQLGVAVVLVLGALTLVGGAAGDDSRSHRLQAGASFWRIGDWYLRPSRPASLTLEGAIDALGKPTSCRADGPGEATATWRNVGVRVKLATLGGLPKGEGGCEAADLIHVVRAVVTGREWTTARGLRVGDSGYRVRRLYPARVISRRDRGLVPELVLARHGVSPVPRNRLPATMREAVGGHGVLPVEGYDPAACCENGLRSRSRIHFPRVRARRVKRGSFPRGVPNQTADPVTTCDARPGTAPVRASAPGPNFVHRRCSRLPSCFITGRSRCQA